MILPKRMFLILDDFGLSPLTDEQRRDLLEILDDRHDKRSTIVTSQVPIKLWHEAIGNETLADAILDRLVHNSHRLEIRGESMRKTKSKEVKTN
jgi:DNA replication protein DnaC